MDYALLAATALGAIGLYLMLPRERARLVGVGGIVGAVAVAGLLLYLVRTAEQLAPAGVASGRPPVYFYLFASIMIAGAVGVVCQPRPVYAALYFVLVTLAGAGMFVLLLAEFMAVVLIIIYAGAILVTYVFVIMLASQGSTGGAVVAPAYDRKAGSPCVAVAVSFLLVGAVLQALFPVNGKGLADSQRGKQSNNPTAVLMAMSLGDVPPNTYVSATMPGSATEPAAVSAEAPTNVQVLGASLYTQYGLSLELAGILLTIALVGAVVIARKNTEHQLLGSGKLPSE